MCVCVSEIDNRRWTGTAIFVTDHENLFLDGGQMEVGLIKNGRAWQCMLGAAPMATIDP